MIQVWTGECLAKWAVLHYDDTFHSMRDPVGPCRPVYRMLHRDYRADRWTAERLGRLRSWWYWHRPNLPAYRRRMHDAWSRS